MSDVTVRLGSVGKRYGSQRAVDQVDFTMRAGEVVALVGHNGAGKSTLIKLMLGLILPTEGRVEVLGVDPAGRAAAAARMALGFLPENVVFHPSMTGAELLAFYARLKRQPVRRNAALLERVGIAHAASRPVGAYSKGMRQRLGLAQALIGRPRVLLLDEPTTGLDPALRRSFYEIVGELSGDGASVLLSSHALAEMESRMDRVVALSHGRKIADGTLAALRQLSDVPTRIRLTMLGTVSAIHPEMFGNQATWRWVGERVLEVGCSEAAKVETLGRLLSASLPLADIEILSPTLDEIYAGFLTREAAE